MRNTNQIQSGVGDSLDLKVKMPSEETVDQIFQQGIRIGGTTEDRIRHYPKVDFDVGVRYKGSILDPYNKGTAEIGIEAQPELCVPYTVKQTKEIPIERVWEAEALFEAEVDITEMEYAIIAHGLYVGPMEEPLEVKIKWTVDVGGRVVQNAKELLASGDGSGSSVWVGSGSPTQYVIRKNSLVDPNNISTTAGVISREHFDLKDAEIIYSFTPIEAKVTNLSMKNTRRKDSHGKFYLDQGFDDDIIGFIFAAKDEKNFYCMLWEGNERSHRGSRFYNTIDGMTIYQSFTSFKDSKHEPSVGGGRSHMGFLADDPFPPTPAQWKHYEENTGWGKQHRRVYKVTNGKYKRVDVTPPGRHGGIDGYRKDVSDLGDGRGWIYKNERKVKVLIEKSRCQIFVTRATNSDKWEKAFDFQMDDGYGVGSYGVLNISQAVEFHSISTRERDLVYGEIPKDEGHEWWKVQGTVTIAEKKFDFIRSRVDFQEKIKAKNKDPARANIVAANVYLKDDSKGKIVSGAAFKNEPIILKSNVVNEKIPFSVRFPESHEEWDSWKGIGQKQIAAKSLDYVHEKVRSHIEREAKGKLTEDGIHISGVEGIVRDEETGKVIIEDFDIESPIILETFNPPDAGEILKERNLYCDVATITPDHRDKETAYEVFPDIKNLFLEEKYVFFNRNDLINKKEEYNIVVPAEPEEPESEDGEIISLVTEGGCSTAEVIIPEEECWKDFDFDGTTFLMWSCEFPVLTEVKDFTACVAKFEGDKIFRPINDFDHNKWSIYELMYDNHNVDPKYDTFGWENSPSGIVEKDNIMVSTKRNYLAKMDEEGNFRRIIEIETDEGKNIKFIDIPSAPEQYVNQFDRREPMGNYESDIHFFVRVYDKHPDINLNWARFDPVYDEFIETQKRDWIEADLFKLNKLRNVEEVETDTGDIIQIESTEQKYLDFNYRLRAVIKESIKTYPWDSGMKTISLSINGQEPLTGSKRGKKDLTGIDLMFVDFPSEIVPSSIEGPFVVVTPKGEYANVANIKTTIKGDYADFSCDLQDDLVEYSPFETKIGYDKGSLRVGKEEIILYQMSSKKSDVSAATKTSIPSTFKAENIEFITNNPRVSLYSKESINRWINAFNNNEELYINIAAKTKESFPGKWNPLIHNGYYYIGEESQENYLYSKLKEDVVDRANQMIDGKPQQGSPVITRVDRDGEILLLKRVSSLNKEARLHTKEEFVSEGNPRIYLKARSIRTHQIAVYIDKELKNFDHFMVDRFNSTIEFYKPPKKGSLIEVYYLQNRIFNIDNNPVRTKYSSGGEKSLVMIGTDINPAVSETIVAYESSKNTPFYREEKIEVNPITSRKRNGFIYLDEMPSKASIIRMKSSKDFIDYSNKDSVVVTIFLEDEYGAGVPNEEVKLYLGENYIQTVTTGHDGVAYFDFEPSHGVNHLLAEHKNNLINQIVIASEREPDEFHYLKADIDSNKFSFRVGEAIPLRFRKLNQSFSLTSDPYNLEISYLEKDYGKPPKLVKKEIKVRDLQASKITIETKGTHEIAAKVKGNTNIGSIDTVSLSID